MNAFKEKYSKEELKEVVDWFKERMDKLPMALRLNECTKTKNLPKAVDKLMALTERPNLDVCFSGYMSQLFIIRELLREKGME